MKIVRNTEQVKEAKARGFRGLLEFELTPEELADAYTEHKTKIIGLDIGQAIEDFIEDVGAEERCCQDWAYRCGRSWASELRHKLEKDDHVMSDYMDRVRDFCREKLKELGIDPDTMERRYDYE